MGMAASQARYLALAARKTNCEYQGQQINQARLNLANQTATLFNQMLGLNVPVPPSTQDFTIMQYSFSDGINPSVIDKWEQLANPDADGYNYVVEYHYDANVYTGFQKKMNDPQIQFAISVPTSDDYTTQRTEVTKIKEKQDAVDKAQKNYDDATAEYTSMQTKAKKLATYRDLNTFKGYFDGANTYDSANGTYSLVHTKTGTETADVTVQYMSYKELKTKADENKINSGNFYLDGTTLKYGEAPEGKTQITKNDKVYALLNDSGVITGYQIGKPTSGTFMDVTGKFVYTNTAGDDFSVKEDSTHTTFKENAARTQDFIDLEEALNKWQSDGISNDNRAKDIYYCISTTDTNDKGLHTIAYKDDLENMAGISNGSGTTSLSIYNITGDNTDDYATIEGMSKKLSSLKDDAADKLNILKAAEAELEVLNIPTYLGNTELESLNKLSQEEFAEIKQIIADMNKNGVNCNFVNCFDSALNIDAEHYSGGIYKFNRDGVTYYTTYYDLAETAMDSKFSNDIDNQPKLNYYHANYVTEPVYKSDKAILDTDSQGRFKTVRFKEDGAQYTLNFEQKTDDAAYEDAMNKYYYENAKYDKMIQDINAKTSIIQQEDRTLELKLKQLDTEQTALSNEMEAVQKIVKDGVEKGFKTFGG